MMLKRTRAKNSLLRLKHRRRAGRRTTRKRRRIELRQMTPLESY
jgi:hypothetical protein